MNDPLNAAGAPATPTSDLMLVNGRTFLIADVEGMVRAPRHGLVFEDVRILSGFTWSISSSDGVRQRQLLSLSHPTPFSATAVFGLSNSGESAVVIDDALVHRQWIGRGARHRFEYRNLTKATQSRVFSLASSTDFAHIFDMKSQRSPVETSVRSVVTDDGLVLGSGQHSTRLTFDPQPSELSDEITSWTVVIEPGETWLLDIEIEPIVDGVPAGMAFASGPPDIVPRTFGAAPTIETTDSRIENAFTRALTDISALRIYDPSDPDNVVVAAGAPWFMTLFGRDSLLTSMLALPWMPDLAVGVIRALANLQGQSTDDSTEEEPGKILHELRRSSGSEAFGDRGRYYGTVDATPLFVMLVAELHERSILSPIALEALKPNIEAAVDWICRAIARDPNGFVSYQRSSDVGLINQGWKDSWDGVSSRDGRLPRGRVALAEVQGYAYAALSTASRLPWGQTTADSRTNDLVEIAASLRSRFNEAFWSSDEGHFITGFSDDGPLDTLTTNPGHAIWCGIADESKAARHLDRSMEPDLFNGWGLRTLSTTAALYNPLSYHNGSVWPHDTALVAAGAHRIGRFDIVDRLADAAFEAASHFGGRPPELFAGFSRDDISAPVAYPSSCSPQAWSSASVLRHLQNVVDLGSDGSLGRTNSALSINTIETASSNASTRPA